jgi:hypothetical protein
MATIKDNVDASGHKVDSYSGDVKPTVSNTQTPNWHDDFYQNTYTGKVLGAVLGYKKKETGGGW